MDGSKKKTVYNTKITKVENKIPDHTDLIKKKDFDIKLRNIINKVTSIKTKKQRMKLK